MVHISSPKQPGSRPILEPTQDSFGRRRSQLLASLGQGRADIAAGRYDVVSRESLRAEFDGVMRDDMSDDELDAMLDGRRKYSD